MSPAPEVSALSRVTIVSGGQTGVDRAALDFAIEYGLPHEGWCPRGRRAEDGAIDEQYRLRETPSPGYAQRTIWNIRDSDATVIFSLSPELTGGTAFTRQQAEGLRKPLLHLARDAEPVGTSAAALRRHAERLDEFLSQYGVERLNVAGPRAMQEPEGRSFVWGVLAAALALG
jgi:hypothetical protein